MHINSTTAILTPSLLLVPYYPHHVSIYHSWMQNPHLRALTASDHLSLDEEFANQKSWRDDSTKLTFIICYNSAYCSRLSMESSSSSFLDDNGTKAVKAHQDDISEVMLGDVNVFFAPWIEVDEYLEQNGQQILAGEINIMIAANASARGKGLGREALGAVLRWILENQTPILKEYRNGISDDNITLPNRIGIFVAKIDEDNKNSIKMFQKCNFKMKSEGPNYFGEIEMTKNAMSGIQSLGDWAQDINTLKYQDDEV